MLQEQTKTHTRINLELDRLINTSTGDNRPCRYCRKPIVLLVKLAPNGKKLILRINRVDCEDVGKFEVYHLACYDILLFGKVMTHTMRKIRQIEEEFGEA